MITEPMRMDFRSKQAMRSSVLTRRELIGAAGATAAYAAVSRARAACAQGRRPMPDVLVLLPGITGSVLRKDGRDVWAPTVQGLLGALASFGGNLRALKLTADPPDRDDLGDGVTADELVPDTHLVPGLWKIDGYSSIAREIKRVFAVEPGRNYFEFPYDWRRDNVVAARRLAKASHEWLGNWRQASGNKDARLILIAHSMGGLVSRYFLECMEGWKVTRRLITFGTPFWGSLNALNFLVNGYRKSLGPVNIVDLTELLRSLASVYQLLPVYPCYDPGDKQLVVVARAKGIPNVSEARAQDAFAFHQRIADSQKANQSDSDYSRRGYSIHTVAGIFQPTLQAARLVSGKVEFSSEYPGKQFDGDGTVPRPSAKPREYQKDPFFVVEIHGSLQNSRAALGQLAGVLTNEDFEASFAALKLQLQIEDSYSSAESVRIAARHDPAEVNITVRAKVQDIGTGKSVVDADMTRKPEGFHQLVVNPLPAGSYRVTVSSGSTSVTDLFLVAAP